MNLVDEGPPRADSACNSSRRAPSPQSTSRARLAPFARVREVETRVSSRARALDSHLSRSPRARRQRPRDGYPNPNRPEPFRASLDMRDVLISRDVRMPTLAFGTYRLRGDECRDAVREALAVGFRHVDTATCYRNERAVAEALAATSSRRPRRRSSRVRSHRARCTARRRRRARSRAWWSVSADRRRSCWCTGPDEAKSRRRATPIARRAHARGVRSNARYERVCVARSGVKLRDFTSRGITRRRGDSTGGESSRTAPSISAGRPPPICAERRVRVVGYSPLGVGALLTEPRVVSFAEDVGLPPAPGRRWSLALAGRRRQIVDARTRRGKLSSLSRDGRRGRKDKRSGRIRRRRARTRVRARSGEILLGSRDGVVKGLGGNPLQTLIVGIITRRRAAIDATARRARG